VESPESDAQQLDQLIGSPGRKTIKDQSGNGQADQHARRPEPEHG
jgi:hypothetical protein